MTDSETQARIDELRVIIDNARAELTRLTGDVHASVLSECRHIYRGVGNECNLVAAVKHFREKTGSGLRESKDAIDLAIVQEGW